MNLPSESSIELISNKNKIYQAVKSFIFGKKEYRITQAYKEESNRLSEVVEEIYNAEIIISEDELQNELYDIKFVVNKLKPILSEYLQKNLSNET